MFMNLLIFRMFQFSPLVVFKRSWQPKVELQGREMGDEFCLKMPDFHVTFRDLLRAVNLRHGTDGFTSPPKEGVLRNFFALKSPTPSFGFEPANLGTKGQHTTSRPPKPPRIWRFPFNFSPSWVFFWFFLVFPEAELRSKNDEDRYEQDMHFFLW